jgi:dCMP deaminase
MVQTVPVRSRLWVLKNLQKFGGFCIFRIFRELKMTAEKQEKYDRAYLRMALEWAQLSYCERKQVGALIVKNKMIISDGYNGTPSGFENCCEDEAGDTKWHVLHAEANAILKTASSTHNCSGGTLYLTMSPCKDCSKLVHQAGITRLVYLNKYSDTSGVDFLKKAGIEVVEFDKNKL